MFNAASFVEVDLEILWISFANGIVWKWIELASLWQCDSALVEHFEP